MFAKRLDGVRITLGGREHQINGRSIIVNDGVLARGLFVGRDQTALEQARRDAELPRVRRHGRVGRLCRRLLLLLLMLLLLLSTATGGAAKVKGAAHRGPANGCARRGGRTRVDIDGQRSIGALTRIAAAAVEGIAPAVAAKHVRVRRARIEVGWRCRR